MSQDVPRVSIGLPVYNGENFLAEAIESLLGQTYTDFELIISDNASIDKTAEIARDFAASDNRIRYVRSDDNMGCSWNYNRTFELARGEFFRWAAHDDLCAPTLLQRCVELLEEDPGAIWCHSKSIHIDGAGRHLERQPISYARSSGVPRPTREAATPHERLRGVVLGPPSCLDAFGLMRSDYVRRTGMRLPYYGEEKVFIGELSLLGRYREVPEALFFVRVHFGASGSLPTAAEQQQFVAPKRKAKWTFTRLGLLGGYLRAIRRAPLSTVERIRCYQVIGSYLLQIRKWKRVLTQTLRGRGNGGGTLAWLESQPVAAQPMQKEAETVSQ